MTEAGLTGGSSHGAGELRCPSCHRVFVLRDEPGARSSRCGACRASVSQTGNAPERWIYPLPAASESNSAEATLATHPTDAMDRVNPSPRRIDRYELRGTLGRGGMGVVYDAWDPELGRSVALKVLMGGAYADASSRRRFVLEARAAAGLDDDGIVRVVDLGFVDDMPYFTMERIYGPSLQQVLDDGGPLPPQEVVRIVRRVCRAVEVAHAAGIAHRDLKPANILMDGDGAPHIADFGLAKSLDNDATATRAIMGTPAFMAPEVARGAADVDWVAADVYGLGALLFACLTGTAPPEGATASRQLIALAEGRLRRVRDLAPRAPEDLACVVDTAIGVGATPRYATAAELRAELDAIAAGSPVRARPEGWLGSAARVARRHRRAVVAASLALVTAAAVMAAPTVREHLAARQREEAALQAWSEVARTLAGDPEDVRHRRRVAFARDPAHRGTLAAARAWLAQGDDLANAPPLIDGLVRSTDPESESYAEALGATDDPGVRAAALLRLARIGISGWYGAPFGEVVDRLDPFALPPEDRDEALDLKMRWTLAAGRVDEAAEVWRRAREVGAPVARRFEPPDRILDLYGHGTRLPHRADRVGVVADEAGRVVSLRLWRDGRMQAVDVQDLWTARAVDETPPPPADGMWRSKPGGRHALTAQVDLDGDGVDEVYEHDAAFRSLIRREPDGTATSASAELDATGSYVGALTVADVDGDGPSELIVAMGEWRAYDLRIMDWDPARGLITRARGARGQAEAVGTAADPARAGRRIVTVEAREYPSQVVFGPRDPAGPPPSIVSWSLDGDTLREDDAWPLLSRRTYASVAALDLNGDGRDEIAMRGALVERGLPSTTVLWFDADGRFTLSVLPGAALLGVVEVDDDPTPELLVSTARVLAAADPDQELWVLGAGDAPFTPARIPRSSATIPVPSIVVDDGARQVWRAADDLFGQGLTSTAAQLLADDAEIRASAEAATATRTAADLWALDGQLRRAALALERVAITWSDGDAADAAYADAVSAWLDAGEPPRALALAEVWRARAGGPSGALATRLDAWRAAAARPWRLDAQAPTPPGAQRTRPFAWISESGLLLDLATVPPSLEVPFDVGEGPALIALDLLITHQDWAGLAELGLQIGEWAGMSSTNRFGGGGVNFQRVVCFHDGRTDFVDVAPRSSVSTSRMSVRFVREVGGGSWSCHVEVRPADALDYKGASEAHLDLGTPPDTDTGRVFLKGSGLASAHTIVEVERLEMWGVTPRVDAGALAGGGATGGDGALLEGAVALVRARRPDAALDALRALSMSPEETDALTSRLRLEPSVWAPLVRVARPREFSSLMEAAWGTEARTGVGAALVRETLWNELEGLQAPEDPTDPAWGLMAARARLQLLGGDATRGLAAAEAWFAAAEPLDHPSLDRVAAELHLAVSRFHRSNGDAARADAHEELAIRRSPSPELMRDRFTRFPGADGSPVAP